MPVYDALLARLPEQVWQTTHLGGHRFAATLVVLPHGICYGRLGEDDVSGLAASHARGAFYDLDKVRGRSCYEAEAQAAEVVARKELGESGLGALRLLDVTPLDHAVRVRFAHTHGEHTVELARTQFAPAPASCGATPKPVAGLVALRRGT
jgi:hypothetical protein